MDRLLEGPPDALDVERLGRALGIHNAYHPDPDDDYGYEACVSECAASISREYADLERSE